MAFSILGCPHRHMSFPMVTRESEPGPPRPASASAVRPHVTCLDCGTEFWYDWTKMRRQERRIRTPQPVKAA